ncbi:hypothetical protein FOQG_16175 [Fusarium oxysporum f. sp. raphani 54005]|uniref:C2H2-type domain-containing protein n=1 Tax=Fusarium oxysporum f. sp. raphani 54005 TaxID=1089458 RepID=X0BAM5_FUSOX|nr:hypothetical protein FOQG_16175 [Fusarium oxysporum f. sp. raphani 54005]
MCDPPSSNTTVGSPPSALIITPNNKAPANIPPKTDKPRPHVCGTCQRSFARLEHLKRHERSHTKEKPFECPECSRRFARSDLLLRHRQKLHQTSIPSSRPRNRRGSASGVAPGQSRARKNSVARPNPTASNAPATSMRPRANAITHVDGSTMQMMAAANISVVRGMCPSHTHSRHSSLAGSPIHSLDHDSGGMSAAIGLRDVQNGLPKLETHTLGGLEFSNGLQTAPPTATFNTEFDLEGFLFGPSSTTNPKTLHYSDLPQPMALEQASSLAPSCNEIPLNQTLDEDIDCFTGFEHQIFFNMSETLVDGSSPSTISTRRSTISDVMLHGSIHPSPTGTSTMWQPSVMDFQHGSTIL